MSIGVGHAGASADGIISERSFVAERVLYLYQVTVLIVGIQRYKAARIGNADGLTGDVVSDFRLASQCIRYLVQIAFRIIGKRGYLAERINNTRPDRSARCISEW